MDYKVSAILLGAILMSAAVSPAQSASTRESGRSLAIVFKDGHQKSLSIAEVSRIEFKDSSLVLSRGGREETIPLADVLRIDFTNHTSPLGRNHFLGKWKVGDGNGSTFYITLELDGEATKTIGASHGTWVVVDGEARISWDDGWHDAIRKVGNKHEKLAYEPGKSFDDSPSNVADAKSLNAQPI